jgi:hypothetical protein
MHPLSKGRQPFRQKRTRQRPDGCHTVAICRLLSSSCLATLLHLVCTGDTSCKQVCVSVVEADVRWEGRCFLCCCGGRPLACQRAPWHDFSETQDRPLFLTGPPPRSNGSLHRCCRSTGAAEVPHTDTAAGPARPPAKSILHAFLDTFSTMRARDQFPFQACREAKHAHKQIRPWGRELEKACWCER